MHNAFKKYTEALDEGHALELAYNLHSWFSDKPCKIEDFQNLCECVNMSDKSLFEHKNGIYSQFLIKRIKPKCW